MVIYFFPKFNKNHLVNFKDITINFFNYINLEIKKCVSENEAKNSVISYSNPYPIYFFKTDTFGEKLFEEFYTNEDNVDNDRFHSMGVIKKSKRYSINNSKSLIDDLTRLFESKNLDKNLLIKKMKSFIPNFKHIDSELGLDQKM